MSKVGNSEWAKDQEIDEARFMISMLEQKIESMDIVIEHINKANHELASSNMKIFKLVTK